MDIKSFIEAVRRGDGSAQPQHLSPADLRVAYARIEAVEPKRNFGFN